MVLFCSLYLVLVSCPAKDKQRSAIMQTIDLSTQKKNRIFYFDLLKAFACISVVFIHISTIDWHSTPINSLNWTYLNFYNSFSRWGVPVFFMISGALLLGNTNNLSLDKLYKKSILRFCTATVFWSVTYATLNFLLKRNIKSTITILISGEYHLWFIFTIITLYALAPILNEFAKNEKTVRYSLILLFSFSFLFRFFDILLAFDIPHTQFFILQFKKAIDQFGFLTNAEYLFYFILGYFLHNTQLKRKTEKVLLVSGALALVVTFFGTELLSLYSNEAKDAFYKNNTINVLFSSVAIFIAAKKFVIQEKIPKLFQTLLTFISKHSFGVYLSHIFIIKTFIKFGFTTQIFHPILSVPFLSVIVFIISLTISYIISKIPLLKKWII